MINKANNLLIEGLYQDDVSKSLSLGILSILHKDLSPSQFIWLNWQVHLVVNPSQLMCLLILKLVEGHVIVIMLFKKHYLILKCKRLTRVFNASTKYWQNKIW